MGNAEKKAMNSFPMTIWHFSYSFVFSIHCKYLQSNYSQIAVQPNCSETTVIFGFAALLARIECESRKKGNELIWDDNLAL